MTPLLNLPVALRILGSKYGNDGLSLDTPRECRWSIREQGNGIENNLPNGITCRALRVSPVTLPSLPKPRS
jgi:hypothetical protein